MAQCKGTAQEFVQEAFSPTVAVLCSHDAELICQKNNLSFVELIQPFCKINTEAHIRDPGNVTHTLHNLRITVREMNQSPPQPTLVKKMLNEAVSNALPQNYDTPRSSVITVGAYDLQLSSTTPWYEAYRECFLQVAQPSDHEFLKHFLACIFVVSSSHADPMDQFAKLTQEQHVQQHQQANKQPLWFCPNVLHYYVLIHDVMAEQGVRAESVYQSMKSTYGVNSCHLLHINSRNPLSSNVQSMEGNMPDPWSQYLHRKRDNNEMPAFDAVPVADSEAFPSHVQEGQQTSSTMTQSESMLSLDGVDSAFEATEDQSTGPPAPAQTGLVIDHPLAPDIGNHTNHAVNVADSVILPDTENNPLTDAVITETKTTSQVHGGCLSLSDHDRLRIFVHEFVVRGLIPWVERTLRTLNEQVTSRKGIHRSFLSISKKWFVGNKPTSQSPTTERSSVIYTPEAPEMQIRRLADLAFMFQLYELAYQMYHAAKKEFNSEHAWLHFAGALEMACMAVFMQGANSQRQYPNHYMESAISTYLNTCKSTQFATRATLLSTEALKSKGLYTEAAQLFIKMTSEDSDLRSALLLEQAAHCFIKMKQPMVRKYAFHMILAGHRFSKAGQRRHALRSYSQASQVYKGKDWSLAEDHINFTLGRQSFNLKQLENATSAFKHLLSAASKQSPPQQNAFLREYLFVFKQQLNQYSPDGSIGGSLAGELPQLPLPTVSGNDTKVLVIERPQKPPDGRPTASSIDFTSSEEDSPIWHKLEEIIVVSKNGSLPFDFKPSLCCYTNWTDNRNHPICVLGEPLTLEVVLSNPLKVPLVLLDVTLLWKFLPVDYASASNDKSAQVISNESTAGAVKNQICNEVIDSEVISELVLQGGETKHIHLCLVCRITGDLHITGLAYSLGTNMPDQGAPLTSEPANLSKPSFVATITVRGKATLEVQGQRLNNTKEEKANKMYGPDRRLDVVIVPPMPKLEVIFSEFPVTLLCGEVRQLSVEFKNTGHHPLNSLKVACTCPAFFTLGSHHTHQNMMAEWSIYETLTNTSECDSEEYVAECPDVKFVHEVSLPSGHLDPGDSLKLPMWIRGHPTAGHHDVHFLFYYQSAQGNPKLKYRVLHHKAKLVVHQSLSLRACAIRAQDPPANSETSKDSHPQNIIISLEVENMNNVQDASITEFSILQVSCVSCHWHLCHLSTQRHSDIKIVGSKSTLICLRASKCKNPVDPSSNKKVFTNVTFDQHQIHSAAAPCAEFYSSELSSVNFDDYHVIVPKSAVGLDVTDHKPVTNPFQALEEALRLDLTLIILWKAFVVDSQGSYNSIQGQHHISLKELNIPVFVPPVVKVILEQGLLKLVKEPEEEGKPKPRPIVTSQLVKYQLGFPTTVCHNFKHKRLCKVAVHLSLYNCSASGLEVRVNTSNHGDKPVHNEDQSQPEAIQLVPPTLSAGQSRPTFVWSGRGSTSLSLAPSTIQMLTLHAVFNQRGVYDLDDLAVTVLVEGLWVTQKSQGSHQIVIKESESSKGNSEVT